MKKIYVAYINMRTLSNELVQVTIGYYSSRIKAEKWLEGEKQNYGKSYGWAKEESANYKMDFLI